MPLILVIDDDETILLSLGVFFNKKGYDVLKASTGKEGLDIALRECPDVVLLDLRLPDIDGFEVLKQIKTNNSETAVIIMTGYGEIKGAVTAIKIGAEHYFQKPVDLDEIAVLIEKSLSVNMLKRQVSLSKAEAPYPIYGVSRHVQGLFHIINLLASNPSTTVFITGETGTGKELVARNIHALSSRADKAFVDINCASIPDTIIESELFGYEAGAFTDAKKTKKGLFEQADGGSIFLDEIGEMPQSAQAKLLRVLESKSLRRLGSIRDIRVDVRIIAATNKDLTESVKGGFFREDLYYRINVMPVNILPLRERTEDIPVTAESILGDITSAMGKWDIKGFMEDAMVAICAYGWPGNVRELKNVLERAVILAEGAFIKRQDLMLPEKSPLVNKYPCTLKEMEKLHIERALKLTNGNKTKAAEVLGISRSTLNEKLKHYS